LEFKGGDCDDLTTLLCSLMESCGIQTALITTPGHIFVAFNTKMTYSKTWENLSEEYGVLDVDGTVWIPIEVTAVGKGFLEAWKIGTSILMAEDFEFVSVEDSFTRYKSVTAIIPEKELYVETQMEKNFNREAEEKINSLFNNSLQKNSVECVEVDELNILAEEYFLVGQIEKSIEVLLKAYSLEQNNQNVLENLAELYRIKGDEKASKKYFDKAQKIQNNFEEKERPQTRESDNSSISLKNKSAVKKSTGGVRIKNKQGVIKRTKPVVSNIKSETVTQRSVQTTSSRADEINIFKWKK
jgi:tetratricopeptide (TPR) repeat protein